MNVGSTLKTAVSYGPLALGAAFAGHGVADAKTTTLDQSKALLPDAAVLATAAEARELGKSLLAQNKVPEALQAFKRASLQDPESVEALNGIAVCFDRLGRFEDSRTHYEMALGIDPSSPALLANYGLSLFLQGKGAEAERFLSLAAASGDPEVQAMSLKTLARIEQKQREARFAAAMPVADDDTDGSARIVRTSAHEQRLVLGNSKTRGLTRVAAIVPANRLAEMQQMAGISAHEAAAIAPIGGLTAREEARIEAQEMAAIAAEMRAREASALLAAEQAARNALPAEMQAMESAALAAAAMGDLPGEFSFAADGVTPLPRDWWADQILTVPAGERRRDNEQIVRPQMTVAMLAAGVAPQRPVARTSVAQLDEAGDTGLRKRAFENPFESDNSRLNGFAGRIHGRELEERASQPELSIAEKVARLEALIERVRQG